LCNPIHKRHGYEVVADAVGLFISDVTIEQGLPSESSKSFKKALKSFQGIFNIS
jgi:hypothetical protein